MNDKKFKTVMELLDELQESLEALIEFNKTLDSNLEKLENNSINVVGENATVVTTGVSGEYKDGKLGESILCRS